MTERIDKNEYWGISDLKYNTDQFTPALNKFFEDENPSEILSAYWTLRRRWLISAENCGTEDPGTKKALELHVELENKAIELLGIDKINEYRKWQGWFPISPKPKVNQI